MIDAEDLTRRHLHLWQDCLTALMADSGSLGCYSSGSLSARRLQEIPRRVTPPRSTKPSCPDRQLAPGDYRRISRRDDVMADLASRFAR